jgi:4-amino-4-deoxy-L-arabinose transferase-like glycosyltransferase
MRPAAAMFGVLLLAAILYDGFSTIVLARRSQRMIRISRTFYRLTWSPFSAIGRRIHQGHRREDYLSLYGPLSLVVLPEFWAAGLMLAFGLLQWSASLRIGGQRQNAWNRPYVQRGGSVYAADGLPDNAVSRISLVAEPGLGFVSSA